MILDMMDYCEAVNGESINSKVYSVDTAADFFAILSVCVKEDNKFIKDLNKSRDIIEDSFNYDPESDYV
jgi:hypothetical protein